MKDLGMIRMKLNLTLLTALLAAILMLLPASASAGLKSQKTKLADASLSGTITTCEPQVVSARQTIRLPGKAAGVRYSGPRVGASFELDFDPAANPELASWAAEVTKVKTKRRGTRYTATLTLTINPSTDCADRLRGPAEWSLELEFGAKYGMKPKDRFYGFMADFEGDRQNSSVTGNYHSLEFRDRLGLSTRYKVCANGIFGSQCWRRSTNDSGYSSIEASLAINDRIGQGVLRWYVGGKLVARFRYELRSEGV